MIDATTTRRLRVGVLTSHPIQYQAPWFRLLAREVELAVYFAHKPTPKDQGIGFGKEFTWDIDLLSGYDHSFLRNVAANPNVNNYSGCDTPEIEEIIAQQTKEQRFDAFIVSGWYLKCYWQAVKACRKAGIPVLVRGDSQLATPRSWLKKVAKQIYYRWMLRKFDGFLSVGRRHQEYLEYYGVPARRIFSVPHFVDNEWFAEHASFAIKSRKELRTSWGAREDQIVILFVGKLIPEKGLATLLSALAVIEKIFPKFYKAVFIGSGPLEADCKKQAELLGLAIAFVGFKNQAELPACYVAADVLALSSTSETWGLVVNEAMACGIPAVVSEAVGCAPDLIDDGKTGFVFPPGDVEVMASKLTLIAEMKNRHHDWSPALHEKLKHYSVQRAVTGTVHAVQTLVEKA